MREETLRGVLSKPQHFQNWKMLVLKLATIVRNPYPYVIQFTCCAHRFDNQTMRARSLLHSNALIPHVAAPNELKSRIVTIVDLHSEHSPRRLMLDSQLTLARISYPCGTSLLSKNSFTISNIQNLIVRNILEISRRFFQLEWRTPGSLRRTRESHLYSQMNWEENSGNSHSFLQFANIFCKTIKRTYIALKFLVHSNYNWILFKSHHKCIIQRLTSLRIVK